MPTAVSDDRATGDFEPAVSLTASLAAHFHQQGFAVRLLVGAQEIPHGVGEPHLHRMLHVLALCEPVPVGQSDAAALDGLRALGDRTARGELTIVVMSWQDPAVEAACRGASRLVPAWETR